MRKRLLIFLAFFLSFALVAGATLAWFEFSYNRPITIRPGDFDIEIDVYFDDVLLTSNESFYDASTGLLTINAFDVNATNYIGDLKVVIRVSAHNDARVRVRIQDEWRLIRTYTNEEETVFVIPSEERDLTGFASRYQIGSEFFNRPEDVFFYYDGLITDDEVLELTFLDGGTPYPILITDTFTERVFITFSIYVDVVQANRIVDVWQVEATLFD